MLDPPSFNRVADLDVHDFFVPLHSKIWAAAHDLVREDQPIDIILLADRVGDKHLPNLTSYLESVTTTTNIEHHASQVRECAAKRRLAAIGDTLRRQAMSDDTPACTASSEAMEALQTVFADQSKFYHISEAAKAWIMAAQKRYEDPDNARSLGVPTQVQLLNDALSYGGFARGHMSVIGAESSRGKTALLDIPIALSAARAGQHVALATLEDDGRAVFCRALSSTVNIQNRQLQQEVVGDTEWQRVTASVAEIAKLPIHLFDRVPGGVDKLCAIIRRHCQEHRCDLIGIDYLQYIQAGVKTEGRTAASEYVISRIAALARELPDTATVLLSQYRKLSDGDKRPTDDDLRDANAVRYYAHAILHIWQPPQSDGSWRVLLLTKNKNGPVGPIPVRWQPRFVTYSDAEPEHMHAFEQAGIAE